MNISETMAYYQASAYNLLDEVEELIAKGYTPYGALNKLGIIPTEEEYEELVEDILSSMD